MTKVVKCGGMDVDDEDKGGGDVEHRDDDGGALVRGGRLLPTAHWSATGKFSAGGKHYFTLDSHWNTGTHCFDARRITLECWQKFH